MRHLKKIRETDAGSIEFHWFFTNFVRRLIFEFFFFTNADVVTIKDKFFETNGGRIKEQDVPLTQDSTQV